MAATPESPLSAGQNRSSPLRSPWQVTKAVWYALILREIQAMFWSRRFGMFWVLAEPIAHIALMMLLFTYIRGREMTGVPLPLWLLVGIVPFFMMRDIAMGAIGVIKSSKALFTYRQVKPFDVYIARAIVEVLVNASVFLILASFMVFFLRYPVPIHEPIFQLGVLIVMVLLALGLGIFLSLVVHAFPDIEPIIRLLFFPLYLLSGVIFPLNMIPKQYYEYLLWNPFLHLIDLFRQYSLAAYTPLEGTNFIYPSVFALVLLFFSLLFYRIRQHDLVMS